MRGAAFHGELRHGVGIGGLRAGELHADFAKFRAVGLCTALGRVAIGEQDAVPQPGAGVDLCHHGVALDLAHGGAALLWHSHLHGGALRVGGGGVALDVAHDLAKGGNAFFSRGVFCLRGGEGVGLGFLVRGVGRRPAIEGGLERLLLGGVGGGRAGVVEEVGDERGCPLVEFVVGGWDEVRHSLGDGSFCTRIRFPPRRWPERGMAGRFPLAAGSLVGMVQPFPLGAEPFRSGDEPVLFGKGPVPPDARPFPAVAWRFLFHGRVAFPQLSPIFAGRWVAPRRPCRRTRGRRTAGRTLGRRCLAFASSSPVLLSESETSLSILLCRRGPPLLLS